MENQEAAPRARLRHAALLRCPNCGNAKVFYRRKHPFVKPEMRDRCEACGYQFHRGDDFYSGVRWLSYGMALVEGLLAFVLARYLVFGLDLSTQILIALLAVFFLAGWNYRMARVLWLERNTRDPASS